MFIQQVSHAVSSKYLHTPMWYCRWNWHFYITISKNKL